MTRLTILEYPDPRLRTVAQPVEVVDDELRSLIDDMFETMYASNGIGLAATQVNIHRRLLVADISDDHDQPLALVNPEVLEREDVETTQEGCLSVPGIFDDVERAQRVHIRALGRDGKPFEMTADGLLAVCIQHEIDHLDGKLFIDYLKPLRRQMITRKMEKLKREMARAL